MSIWKTLKEKHKNYMIKSEKPVSKFIMVSKSVAFALLILASFLLYYINERILAGVILSIATVYIILIRLDSLGKEIIQLKKELYEQSIEIGNLKRRKEN
ncbi:hypothetical protein LCGC14_1958510 [marine sediment metagenome]|uniref:Uncharacterized protein n=1 Tax=marine sediment metagenome TaxID=412755 RepID=A0A0F9FFJ0_9ZZZZ